MREISRAFPVGQALPTKLESIVLAGALDVDMNVRETALGILRDRNHSALAALAAAQLQDPDPQVGLLGLNHLKRVNANIGVPAIKVLRGENETMSNQLANARQSQSLNKAQLSELLRLRGEVGPLRRDSQELAKLRTAQRVEQPAPAQPAPPRHFVPATAWANVGIDKPENAIQTFFWAGMHGETNLVSNLLRWQRDADIPASDELDQTWAKAMVSSTTRFAGEFQGFRVASQQEDSNEVRLAMELTDQNGKVSTHNVRLVREDNQWFPVMNVWMHQPGSIRAALDVPAKFQQAK